MIKYSDEVVSTYGNVKRVGDVAKFTADNYIGWTIEALQYALNMDGGKVTFSSKEARESFLNSLLQLTRAENMNKSFQEKQGVLVTRYWADVYKSVNRKEGLFHFKDEEGYRYLNYFGDDAFSRVFDCATRFSEGLARVSKDELEYFIDATGQKVFDCDPDLHYGEFHTGLACIWDKSQKFGYVNGIGQVVIPCTFNRASDFSDGLASVTVDGQRCFIDTTGQKVFDCGPYLNYSYFRDGLARVQSRENNQYGYVDKEGRLAIDCIYTDASHFADGMAIVTRNQHTFAMDKHEKFLKTTSVLTSMEDVSRLPKNTVILDTTVGAVLSFENGDVWFKTALEREDFIKMLDVDQEYTRKRVLD